MSWTARRFHGQLRPLRDSDSTHHRRPRSIGGTSDERNLSELSVSKHRAWHTLFQNWGVERIAAEINERYLDPDWMLIVAQRGTKMEKFYGYCVRFCKCCNKETIHFLLTGDGCKAYVCRNFACHFPRK